MTSDDQNQLTSEESPELLLTVSWNEGSVRMIDQTALPMREDYLDLNSVDEVIAAIRRLSVRGAPAIGVAGAMGLALAATKCQDDDPTKLHSALVSEGARLGAARPTAVNLVWAIERSLASVAAAVSAGATAEEVRALTLRTAEEILAEDLACSAALSRAGAAILPEEARVITHCNTGGLATAGGGTALGVVLEAARQGKRPFVYADETRPLLQGARLTAWELQRAGVDYAVQCDGACAWTLATKKIDAVLVGSDRVAKNGDAANKIGTLALAIAAKEYGVPFYIVAPRSTFDFAVASGSEIPIEQRAREEVIRPFGDWIAPPEAEVFNPAFDVTPARLIRGWITERGVETPPFAS